MSGAHFYTISVNEARLALEKYGYRDDGLAGYVFATQIPGTIPLYHLLHSNSGNHFYTTSEEERDNAISVYGYDNEGIACFVYDGPVITGVVPLYRLANLMNGHHFYTISKTEYEFALAQVIPYTYPPGVDIADISIVEMSMPVAHVDLEPALGKPMYRDESIACYVHETQIEHSLPFRRLLEVAGYTLPAAETPILETILDLNNNLIAPFHASGVFEMQPGERLELRLRAIYPSYVRVKIDDKGLIKVNDSANHPELDTSGYYQISELRAIDDSDPRFFWRVFVVLPLDKRGSVNYAMTVHDISQNSELSGIEKEASPLQITVFRTPVLVPKPSSLFFDAPDAKHNKNGPDSAFIADNITLAGWLVGTPEPNRGFGTEDWHYNIWLDPDFIERNYSATTPPLATAIMPGRWYTQVDNIFKPNVQIPLTGGNQLNASTFLMPGKDYFTVELNAWHASKHNGQVPSEWVADPDLTNWPDVFWAFNVMKPPGIDPSESDLKADDYVIITGALVEDSAHLHVPLDEQDSDYWKQLCWFNTLYGHGGWLEIHPLDSIRLVNKDKEPLVRKHTHLVQLCNNGDNKTPTSLDQYLTPKPSDPPTDHSWLMFREIIDDRFTDMSTIGGHTVEISRYDPTKLHVSVSLNANKGHFKAVYLLWWEERALSRPTAVPMPQTQSFITSDKDEIQFVLEPNVVASNTVVFQLCLGGGLTWEKRMNLPDGLGNSWNLIVKDNERCNTEGLWANQVSNGQVLTFSKEKGFPRGMTKVHELPLNNLGNLPGGTRVTFTWVKD